jgi:hypothetical protein
MAFFVCLAFKATSYGSPFAALFHLQGTKNGVGLPENFSTRLSAIGL